MTELLGNTKFQSRKDIAKGCTLAGKIWNFENLAAGKTSHKCSLTGHIDFDNERNSTAENEDEDVAGCRPKPKTKIAMQGGKLMNVRAWLTNLKKEAKKPSDVQMSILQRVFARCELEAREIQTSAINESSQEPLREMIQGLPGAGKSELIHWVCRGFVDIFGYEHGVQFVKIASQNSMAFLIDGFTNHSWGGVPVTMDQWDKWQTTNWNTPQVSPLFEKNQHLRWILMDEGSTTSAEVLGVLESNVTRSTRNTGTWKLRRGKTSDVRPFGGVNLLFFVDWWQLPPVLSTDLKSNPFLTYSPMIQKVMAMFWSRSKDSFTHMTELTESYRQKLDPWFADFLHQCREGRLSESMYNFFHGWPTKLPGSAVQKLTKTDFFLFFPFVSNFCLSSYSFGSIRIVLFNIRNY